MIVIPGKVETTGGLPFGGVTHDLTLEDFDAMVKRIPQVSKATPLVVGSDTLQSEERSRGASILGTTAEFYDVRNLNMASGRFLAEAPGRGGRQEMVLGATMARELFPAGGALGSIVRMGAYRFRVAGVLAATGQNLGVNIDEVAIMPVQTAMRIWDKHSLFRVLARARSNEAMSETKRAILALMKERHRAEDVTVFTQDSVSSAFSAIFQALTLALVGIASISLAVAGVGIMNVMLVSVTERRAEIGLLKALGATRAQVLRIFLAETILLAFTGGAAGLALGLFAVRLLRGIYPTFPAAPPLWAIFAALGLSAAVGILFGLWPAYRATRLDPVACLMRR